MTRSKMASAKVESPTRSGCLLSRSPGVSHASTKLNDLLLAEIDLPGLPFCPLPSAHQPASEIVKDGLWRDAERRRGALNRIGPIGPARRVCAHPVDLHRRDAPVLAQQPDILAFEGAAPRRDESFLVERGGNLLIHLAGAIEGRDPLA